MNTPSTDAPPGEPARGVALGLLAFYHLLTLGGLTIVLSRPWLGPRSIHALGVLAVVATGLLVAAFNRLAPGRRGRNLLLYLPTATVTAAAVLLHRSREAGGALPDNLPLLALVVSALAIFPLTAPAPSNETGRGE